MGKKLFNVFIICLLIALFIFPGMFMRRFADEIVDTSKQAVDAVHREDWETGIAMLASMNATMQRHKEALHLFLDHKIVEDVDSAMRSCLQLMYVGDQPQALQELAHIITWVSYLKEIEQFNWCTLV